MRRTRFRYENGYPVEKAVTYPESNEIELTFFEYEFADGLPVSMSQTVNGSSSVRTTEYKDALPYEILIESGGGISRSRILLQYTDRGPYFTLLFSSREESGGEGGVPFVMEEADSVSVTLKGGVMVRSVNTGIYANWNEGDEREWMRFNGTYTAYYDDNGILTGTSSAFRAGPLGGEDAVTLAS